MAFKYAKEKVITLWYVLEPIGLSYTAGTDYKSINWEALR